jgi:UDP-2-acetamido-3-amino-2,3-dideoxy-glucuronate N-acetyltransferase
VSDGDADPDGAGPTIGQGGRIVVQCQRASGSGPEVTDPAAFVSPLAEIEEDVRLGAAVSVWQFSKVRRGANIGAGSRVGGGVYIGAGVVVGENCKIENAAQVFEGARLGRGVFIGPGALLLNDRYPRATRPDGALKEATDWAAEGVVVHDGASVGGGAVLLPGAEIGEWALVGGGAVVSGRVDDHALVVGNPARRVGTVCRCCRPLTPPNACHSCGEIAEVPGASQWPRVTNEA